MAATYDFAHDNKQNLFQKHWALEFIRVREDSENDSKNDWSTLRVDADIFLIRKKKCRCKISGCVWTGP